MVGFVLLPRNLNQKLLVVSSGIKKTTMLCSRQFQRNTLDLMEMKEQLQGLEFVDFSAAVISS